MRDFIKKITHPFLRRWAKFYFSKPRKYRYKDIDGIVLPDVFHPQLTLSTNILLNYLWNKNLVKKSFLELGCGTGLITTLAAKKGANTLATDINPKALENATLNAKRNGVSIATLFSNLFDKIPPQVFDYVVINPPYYPKAPQNDAERAWFCGENFEYFIKLFAQLNAYLNTESQVFMILSEDCKLEHIQSIAKQERFQFQEVHRIRKMKEWNFIFRISPTI